MRGNKLPEQHGGKPPVVPTLRPDFWRRILGLMIDGVSTRMDYAAMATERQKEATRLAIGALQALETLGFQAWVVGSLAKGRFTHVSDVDFVVDCDPALEYEAFRSIERSLGDFPFHVVPYQRLTDDALPFMMEGAIDARHLGARQQEAS